jgi:serine/threonine protein kinase
MQDLQEAIMLDTSEDAHVSIVPTTDVINEPGNARPCRQDFVVIGHLGQSNSGTVHLALHRVSGQRFALKEIYTPSCEATDALSQAIKFRKECGNSEHIVHLHDAFTHHHCTYMVLEYMDWGSLDALLLHHRALGAAYIDQAAVAAILRSVLHALDHLHAAHAAHTDLAPRNIALSTSGAVKLTDAGRVPPLVPHCARGLLTSAYKAPEQVRYSPRNEFPFALLPAQRISFPLLPRATNFLLRCSPSDDFSVALLSAQHTLL